MIKITMRLYRMHDLDLMYLYKMPNISIQSIIKVMLKNYIKDRNNGGQIVTRLSIPNIQHDITLPKSAQFHIILQDGEDDDVISWIEQIPKGFRNSMLKNMLRSYLEFPIVIPYEKEVTKKIQPTNKNDISIEKYNTIMNAKAKNKKPKHETVQIKPKKETESVADVVLNTPLEQNKKLNEGDAVLDVSQELKPKTNPVIQPTVNKEKQNNIQESVKPSENSDDLFGDFEDLMKQF